MRRVGRRRADHHLAEGADLQLPQLARRVRGLHRRDPQVRPRHRRDGRRDDGLERARAERPRLARRARRRLCRRDGRGDRRRRRRGERPRRRLGPLDRAAAGLGLGAGRPQPRRRRRRPDPCRARRRRWIRRRAAAAAAEARTRPFNAAGPTPGRFAFRRGLRGLAIAAGEAEHSRSSAREKAPGREEE